MASRVLACLRANLLGAIALFVALGGTSYAAITNITSSQIKNDTIQGKDIRNGTIRSADVGDHSLLRKDFKRGQVPAGKAGPKGERGPQGLAGKNGSELGWARVRPDGTIAASSSPSIVAKLPHNAAGRYCLSTNFTPHAFNATIDSTAGDPRDRVGGTVDRASVFTVCPAGSTTVVTTWQWSDNSARDRGFYIVWN